MTTEQTSDPTLWRYPSLWSANRTIHLRNLEAELHRVESNTVPIERFRELVKTNEKHYRDVCELVELVSRPQPNMHTTETCKWFKRRNAWLSAHTPTGKDKI